jgi:phytanoyl-CoA hydroxylase
LRGPQDDSVMSFYDRYYPEFNESGCVHVPAFLSHDELSELKANIERFIRDVAPSLKDGSVIRTPSGALRAIENFTGDAYFREYARSSKWMELARCLLGKPVRAAEPDELSGSFGCQTYIDMPPGADALTPPHQDGRYHNIVPPDSLNIWVALDPADVSNGGLVYTRGSHRRGLRDHSVDGRQPAFSLAVADFGPHDRERDLRFSLQPGDAAVHHNLTIHRADRNSSDRSRRAFCMFMRAEDCQRDSAGHNWYMRVLDAHVEHFRLKA